MPTTLSEMMNQESRPIFIGDTPLALPQQVVTGKYVDMLGERFYKIENYDAMAPFFMSIVSSSDHWLFISSTGGLSAGRVSSEQSLFPYYTEDKLTENSENTGTKTILLVTRDSITSLWEPFSVRQQGIYHIERDIFKNVSGTVVVFQEINHSLNLTYRYAWRTSEAFGFVKTSWLLNSGASSCRVELVDGLQNILPANVSSATQNAYSPLLDAYKRSELDPETGLALFVLNSTLTDLAEPSESLLATSVMQRGLESADYMLSSRQLDDFRSGMSVAPETEVRGRRGAFFVHATVDLAPGKERSWHLVADVSQDSAAIVRLAKRIREEPSSLTDAVEQDIALNNLNLVKIVAGADGLQVSNHPLYCAHHFANVMFNAMRGGIFADQYRVTTRDFLQFVSVRNRTVLDENAGFFSKLPIEIQLGNLLALAEANGEPNVIRLSYAYLPLSFSRRHGDPSRPWNRFAIHIKNADGTRQLNYEGNWRDIFQNWEALAFSFPEYIESMISTFLSATTVDGYNPYRITRQGIEWEIPEPDNPWANIGYWSDHQIIYLQKLMEISVRVHPGKLHQFLARPIYSYGNVPYRIKPYANLQQDPYKTIDLDWDMEHEIERRVEELGSDGKLVYGPDGRVLHANLAEKLLTLLLAKLVNYVPEGGIWMNTQRPEWNDANNALVGKGLSVVTLCYLRRYIVFFKELLEQGGLDTIQLSSQVHELYTQISRILVKFQSSLQNPPSDEQRRIIMDALGGAGSTFRWDFYSRGMTGEWTRLAAPELVQFLNLALRYVEHAIRANKRSDNLYHAYNVLQFDDKHASIKHLGEMLEGQVAILSSGLLSGSESLDLLVSLRNSKLYRPDQHSYILYPDRELPGFLAKNSLTHEQVSGLELVSALVRAQDKTLIIRDAQGNYHFSGHIRNANDVTRSLDALLRQPEYAEFKSEAAHVHRLFEDLFHHDEFTGRSGTFFAYEGLGSVYWHMVSKLLLAVQETIVRTANQETTPALIEIYRDLGKGQSFNKTPQAYGAFPTDPYSHTPLGQGARQPGMTGMVKEEILTRQVELGMSLANGQLAFDFLLLDWNEFLVEPTWFSVWGVDGQPQQLQLPARSIAYTVCQVPVILRVGDETRITVHLADGTTRQIQGHVLDSVHSKHIFERDGQVHHLVVSILRKE